MHLSFLLCAAGMIDCPGTQDGSSLRSLIDKPPVCGNSFSPLTGALLTGFRLHTGPVLTEYTVHTYKSTHFHHAVSDYSSLLQYYGKFSSVRIYSGWSLNILFVFMFLCLFFPSCQNSTDWCTYSLQRRRANISTSTIDHRTHYHKVWHKLFIYTNVTTVFRPLTWPASFWRLRNSIRLGSQEEKEKEGWWSWPQEKEERQEKEEGKKIY